MLRRPSCGGLLKTIFRVDRLVLSGRCSICPSYTVHPPAAAFRADTDINVPYRFQELGHGKTTVFFPKTLVPLNGKYQLQVFALPPIVQKSIITDFLKTMGKYMHQIATDEFRVIQSDAALRVARPFSPGRKDGLLSVNRKYPAVGDGNLVRISSKIRNGVAETIEGLLYVRTPVFLVKAVAEFCPVVRVTQLLAGRGKSDFFAFIKCIKPGKVFAFKLVAQHPNRDKKAAGGFAYLMVFCQPAAGDDTVHMHMVIKFLVPRVKDLDNTGNCAEILRIGGQFKECFGTASVKKPIQKFLITVNQRIQFMWKSKDHMKVRGIDDLRPALVYPDFF